MYKVTRIFQHVRMDVCYVYVYDNSYKTDIKNKVYSDVNLMDTRRIIDSHRGQSLLVNDSGFRMNINQN